MSGILDSKTRVFDNIFTLEGRRQLANGGLNVRYVTFSDAGTFYEADSTEGVSDATARLYLEASNLSQDQITFKADDSGKLKPFNNSSEFIMNGGQLVSLSFVPNITETFTGSSENMMIITGSAFESQIDGILSTSLDNFKNQYTIGTFDRVFDDDGFAAAPENIEFVITDERPISDPSQFTANLNHLESLFSDPRLSNLINFKFLPPVLKVEESGIDKSKLENIPSRYFTANYKPIGPTQKLTHKSVLEQLKQFKDVGFSKVIRFDPNSHPSNIISQVFESDGNTLKKLDVIDFGRDQSTHIFFIGKVIIDDNETQNFVHIFTLVFE